HPSPDPPAPELRVRHPLLPRRRPRPTGGSGGSRRGAAALSRVGRRLGARQDGPHIDRAGLGIVAGAYGTERRDMSLFDAFRYDGKRALVVGGATGMGAATAELVKDAGAEVVVMDRAEVTLDGVKAIKLDLSDKASIEAAVDECGGPVHALFSCAGVADGPPGLERINFIGHRFLIDRM